MGVRPLPDAEGLGVGRLHGLVSRLNPRPPALPARPDVGARLGVDDVAVAAADGAYGLDAQRARAQPPYKPFGFPADFYLLTFGVYRANVILYGLFCITIYKYISLIRRNSPECQLNNKDLILRFPVFFL